MEWSFEIGFEPSRWFYRQFHTVLKNCNREVVCRHTRQEKSKLRILFFRSLLYVSYFFLELRHPTFWQMTVLKEYPTTISTTTINQVFSPSPLPLPQWYPLNSLFSLWSKSQNRTCWVCSLRQYEDYGCLMIRTTKYLLQADCLNLLIEIAQYLLYVVTNVEHYSLRENSPDQQHLYEIDTYHKVF